jgi:hypothetical protein
MSILDKYILPYIYFVEMKILAIVSNTKKTIL